MDPTVQALLAAAASFVAVSIVIPLIIVLCKYKKRSRRRQQQQEHRRRWQHQQGQAPKSKAAVSAVDESASFDPSLSHISMAELVAATGNFAADGIIGDGSFGFVYKAQLSNGVTVAVKKLSHEAFQGFREFRAEMETLGRIRHPNLVKMLGYCASGDDRVLIYEFVQRGSLDFWLYEGQLPPLDWGRRLKIVGGVAAGLRYLHEGCDPRIIHRDIKASNILLDTDFEARIADFGLARKMDGSHSHVSTQVAGTMGYMPPEYRDGVMLVTVKADVYSFGILMVEVATAKRPNWPEKMDGKEVGLIVWARRMVEEGRDMELLDPKLAARPGGEVMVVEERQVKDYFKIAYECTHESPKDRPAMGEVIQMFHLIQPQPQSQLDPSHQPSISVIVA